MESLALDLAAIVQAQGSAGIALLLVGGTLFTAVGLPRQLVAFVAGFVYGVIGGLPLAWTASVAGCALCFGVSRRYLGPVLQRRYPQAIQRLEHIVADDMFLKILLLRLQPFGTNLSTNLLAGVSSIRWGPFMSASAVGYVPQMLLFVLLGDGLGPGGLFESTLGTALIVISLALVLILYARFRRRRSAS